MTVRDDLAVPERRHALVADQVEQLATTAMDAARVMIESGKPPDRTAELLRAVYLPRVEELALSLAPLGEAELVPVDRFVALFDRIADG